jgi:hypothetical protein
VEGIWAYEGEIKRTKNIIQLGVHNFSSSSNIIRVTKSRRMTWRGTVRMGEIIRAYTISAGKTEEN